jgi:hypothetical protein
MTEGKDMTTQSATAVLVMQGNKKLAFPCVIVPKTYVLFLHNLRVFIDAPMRKIGYTHLRSRNPASILNGRTGRVPKISKRVFGEWEPMPNQFRRNGSL